MMNGGGVGREQPTASMMNGGGWAAIKQPPGSRTEGGERRSSNTSGAKNAERPCQFFKSQTADLEPCALAALVCYGPPGPFTGELRSSSGRALRYGPTSSLGDAGYFPPCSRA
jgi:hypothetical protein